MLTVTSFYYIANFVYQYFEIVGIFFMDSRNKFSHFLGSINIIIVVGEQWSNIYVDNEFRISLNRDRSW